MYLYKCRAFFAGLVVVSFLILPIYPGRSVRLQSQTILSEHVVSDVVCCLLSGDWLEPTKDMMKTANET